MRTLLFSFVLLASFNLMPAESDATKIGQFYVLNDDRTKTYVSPIEAKRKVNKNEKVYFQPHDQRPRKIEKGSVYYNQLFN